MSRKVLLVRLALLGFVFIGSNCSNCACSHDGHEHGTGARATAKTAGDSASATAISSHGSPASATAVAMGGAKAHHAHGEYEKYHGGHEEHHHGYVEHAGKGFLRTKVHETLHQLKSYGHEHGNKHGHGHVYGPSHAELEHFKQGHGHSYDSHYVGLGGANSHLGYGHHSGSHGSGNLKLYDSSYKHGHHNDLHGPGHHNFGYGNAGHLPHGHELGYNEHFKVHGSGHETFYGSEHNQLMGAGHLPHGYSGGHGLNHGKVHGAEHNRLESSAHVDTKRHSVNLEVGAQFGPSAAGHCTTRLCIVEKPGRRERAKNKIAQALVKSKLHGHDKAKKDAKKEKRHHFY